jgi:hypothetical protein
MKQVIQLNEDGYFVGFTTADESPLEPGVFLIPGGCIEAEPPTTPAGKRARWTGASWVFEDLPEPEPEPEPEPLTPEQIVAQYTAAVQKRLDDFARTRGYDGILSAATYAASTVPKFKAEGQYAVEARDATWVKLYQILAEVEAGTRPAPSGYADIEPDLPILEWPA